MGTSGGSGVDPLAPAAPVIVRLTAATDTGSSNSDAISSTANPQYTFNLPSGNPDTNKNIAVDDVLRLAHNGTSVGIVTITQNMIDDIDPIEVVFTETAEGSIAVTARLERGAHIGPWSATYTWTRYASAPTITTNAAQSVNENAALAVSLASSRTIDTWAIRTAVQDAASLDHDEFEISGTTLRWSANGTRDYEAPSDTNTDNAYVVVVRATDLAGNTADKTITVTVADIADNFYIQLEGSTDVIQLEGSTDRIQLESA
jgi:hypothetical protein